MENKKERILAFDVMNILACISVIALHHNALVHGFENTRAWKESLIVECVCYFSVPVFLMVSGANLINYREKYSTQVFFKKRFFRVFIPWIFWSVVLYCWKRVTGQLELETRGMKEAINMILNNQVESVYWFFGSLFACYFAIPLISMAVGNRKVLWYVVGINFIFDSVMPVIGTWFGVTWSLNIPIVGNCIIFMLLGYLLKDGIEDKRVRFVVYAVGLFMVVFRYIYTYTRSIENGYTDVSIKGYNIFHGVLFSVAVFVLLRQIDWNKIIPNYLKNIIVIVANCSFGVFLIHRAVMYYEEKIWGIDVKSLSWRTGFIFVTYLISFGITFIICMIPYVRNVMGVGQSLIRWKSKK